MYKRQGLYDAKFPAEEITRQIQTVRTQTSNGGAIHYHLRSVLENSALGASTRTQYAQPALIPATPWLDSTPPEKPRLTATAGKFSASARWENEGAEPAQWWLLQVLNESNWRMEILPASQTARSFDNFLPEAISLRAVDRLGNLSAPAVLVPHKSSSQDTGKGAMKLRK